MLNGIIFDIHYCQLTLINQYFSNWSLWYSFSLSFPAGSFFQPRNTLSLNHGSIYSFWQLSFVQSLPSFRIQGLGMRIPSSYLNHLSRTKQRPDLIPACRDAIKKKLTQNIEKISTVQFSCWLTLLSFAVLLQLLPFSSSL